MSSRKPAVLIVLAAVTALLAGSSGTALARPPLPGNVFQGPAAGTLYFGDAPTPAAGIVKVTEGSWSSQSWTASMNGFVFECSVGSKAGHVKLLGSQEAGTLRCSGGWAPDPLGQAVYAGQAVGGSVARLTMKLTFTAVAVMPAPT